MGTGEGVGRDKGDFGMPYPYFNRISRGGQDLYGEILGVPVCNYRLALSLSKFNSHSHILEIK